MDPLDLTDNQPGVPNSANSDFLYPSRRPRTYLGQLYSQPLLTTLSGFGQVANLVRNPYELINNVDEFVQHINGSNKRDASSGNVEDKAFPGQGDESNPNTSDQTPLPDIVPIPVIPPIESSNKRGRMSSLTIEEYESDFRKSATDIDIIERIQAGSMACNQLRAALWPYLFGLVLHRGHFQKISSPNGQEAYLFVDHEGNTSRWRELSESYQALQSQWMAITPDQESRFSIYRERRALIKRDVTRCDRKHPFYSAPDHELQPNLNKLISILMSYMMYDFDIGYVQGMSDIAGPILCLYQGDVVKSFWVFVEVMKLFRRNFELSQKTIHFQLSCLHEIIKMTDPVFAQYLADNSSDHCFFAFKAILCQFKRELMNDEENDYSKVLFLWDTIWSVARRTKLQEEFHKLNSETPEALVDSQFIDNIENPFPISVDPNQADSLRFKLTETEIFMLSLCLSMIRRERDIILARKLDGDDIHVHFIKPKLEADLNSFIEHAINIYSYLKFDFDLTQVTEKIRSQFLPSSVSLPDSNKSSSDGNAQRANK